MLGLPYQKSSGLFNSYLYYNKGKHQTYDKINLFPPMNETEVFKPGSGAGIFETELGRFGIAICYDLRFPELFQRLKAANVDMIFVPAAFPRVRISDWEELLVMRARETNTPVIGINAVGDDGVNEFGGRSMVVGGDGKIIVSAGEIDEIVLEVEL
jgi:predicted amidohydrolase